MNKDGEGRDRGSAIEVHHLSFAYDGSTALTQVSFNVERGETLAILGANGAGKTSLLKLITGLREPDRGSIQTDVSVGFAPENPRAGLFAKTVADEVAFFPRNRGLDVDRRVADALRAMNVADLQDRNPYTLSVGEQRRVSIASVLAGAPEIVALDEPTGGLDRAGERRLADLLDGLDATVLISTHAADFAYDAADRAILLKDGEVLAAGSTRDVLADHSLLEEAGVRPPGAVSWARRHGFDNLPADVEEAVAMVRGRR